MLATRCLPPALESVGLRAELGWILGEPGLSERALVERLLLVRDAALVAAREARARGEAEQAGDTELIANVAGLLGLYLGTRELDPQLVEGYLDQARAGLLEIGLAGVASRHGRARKRRGWVVTLLRRGAGLVADGLVALSIFVQRALFARARRLDSAEAEARGIGSRRVEMHRSSAPPLEQSGDAPVPERARIAG